MRAGRDDFDDFFSHDDVTPVVDTRADGRLYQGTRRANGRLYFRNWTGRL